VNFKKLIKNNLIKHKNNLPKYYFIIALIFANILANPIYAINDNEELNKLISLVNHYESIGNSNKAIETNAKLLEVAKEQNELGFQIKALNKMAHRFIDANKFLSGFDAIEQSIALAHKLKSDSILEYLFIYKSKVLQKIDNVDGAIFYLLKAKKIIDKQKDNNALAFYYNSLANLYFNQKEFDKAIDTYRSAAKCYYAINNYYYYRGSIDNIGICYRNLNDFDSAEFYFNQAISIAQNKHSKIGEVNSLINLSKNYFFKKQFKQAIDIGNIVSGEILKNNLSKYFLFENTISIANIFLTINGLVSYFSWYIKRKRYS
jgi:tetratricopeptide (TPR) repeat protein